MSIIYSTPGAARGPRRGYQWISADSRQTRLEGVARHMAGSSGFLGGRRREHSRAGVYAFVADET
jgi:hypothetical protein